MNGTKPPSKSLGIQGSVGTIVAGLVMLFRSIGAFFPGSIDEDAVQTIEQNSGSIAAVVGSLFVVGTGLASFIGRWFARKEIVTGGGSARLYLLLFLLPVVVAGCAPVRVSEQTGDKIATAITDLKAEGPDCCGDLRKAHEAIGATLEGEVATAYANELEIAASLLEEMILRCDSGALEPGRCEQYRATAVLILERIQEARFELPPQGRVEPAGVQP